MNTPTLEQTSSVIRFGRFLRSVPGNFVERLRSTDWRRKRRALWRSIRKNWAILTATFVGAWAVFTWSASERRAADLRAFEARKPFLERQLAIHFELADLIGKLAAHDTTADEWKSAERRFLELYYGPLLMVANDKVRERIQVTRVEIKAAKEGKALNKNDFLILEAEQIVDELRAAVDSTWSRRALGHYGYTYYWDESETYVPAKRKEQHPSDKDMTDTSASAPDQKKEAP